jgi:tRNA wybutosine-synthesizing protein 2
VTIHVENGVVYRFDPLRVTFSGGNRSERIGIVGRIGMGENVVDMFACVGQFSLPMAKIKQATVTAIEVNPDAFDFLVQNIGINRLEDRVMPVLGDCRDVHPVGLADTVVMGYLHNTVDYLEHALECVSRNGGRIYMHQASPLEGSEEIIRHVIAECTLCGFSASVGVRVVKSYSKGVAHLVFEIVLVPMAGSRGQS